MPDKQSTKTRETRRASTASRARRTGKRMTPVIIHSSGVCRSCRTLPVGSTEITSLLLVVVFSLVSVLFTALMALNSQHQKIDRLQQQVQVSHQA